MWCSAKEQTFGRTSPQSDYVRVYSNGTCLWWPLFEHSVSHCPIDVTWYPFDDQRCNLSFESWKFNSETLYFTAKRQPELLSHYNENEEWHIIGWQQTFCLILISKSVCFPITSGHGRIQDLSKGADHGERQSITGWGLKPKALCPFWHKKRGQKLRIYVIIYPCSRQTASCSHDSPQSLVNGGGGRHVHLPLLVDAIPLTSLAIHHEAGNSDFFHMQSRPVLRL